MIGKSRKALVVVATALQVEFESVKSYLTGVMSEVGEHGSRYDLGQYQGTPIAVVLTGAGNVDAAIEVETAITRYNPRYLFFVGIAGGIKDVNLGDVVGVTRVYAFESGKWDPSGEGAVFMPRPRMSESSHYLVQLAQAVSRSTKWRTRCGSGPGNNRAVIGPIVAGEKLVASTDAPDLRIIRSTYSDAVALEMEGFGVLRVGYSREQVRMIVIRGISDLFSGKSAAEAAGSHERASANAAAFAFQMIETLLDDSKTIHDDAWQSLETLLVQLYSLGPQYNEIWNRAGGDLSMLDLGPNGKANWHAAARKLRQGGGGKHITFASLLACVIEDHPNNSDLADLLTLTT